MKILWLVNKDNQDDIKFEGLFNSIYHSVITCESDYYRTRDNNFKDTDALVVQINLGWAGKNNIFDGIRLAQELRLSDNVAIPIVFLSLSLSREEILCSDPSLDIISTFGLSNGFCFKNGNRIEFALPVDMANVTMGSIDDYIKLLPKIDAVRRFDNKYFCSKKDQTRRLKHDIAYNDIEQTKNKLISLFGNDPRISNATTREELYGLCDILEGELRANEVKQSQENAIRVLLLDDKYNEDKGIKFFLEYSRKMLDIKCCKTVKEALDTVESFNPNVVLVDLRLQDSTEYPIINKQQGYDYLNIHKELYPHIGVIILSRLPMSFLKDLSKSMSNFRTFYWKKELEGSTYCDILIQSIVELAIIEFASESPQKKQFAELYNWWYFEKNSSGDLLSPSEEQYSIAPNITQEEYIDIRSKEIIEVIKRGNAIRANGAKMTIDDVFNENKLQREFQKNYDLSDLFIFRRAAIYLYYHFEKNILSKHVVDDNNKKLFDKSEINLYINHILAYHSDYNLNSLENSGITTRYLFLKAKNRRIRSFRDIALTNKEKSFFYNYFPDFFNAWNQKR